jgi:putative phosphoesterase
MVRIGVLSDTHIPERARFLPRALLAQFAQVDHIFHAGDIVRVSVLDELAALAPVTAVRGNMDGAEARLSLKASLTLEGISLGLIHGHGGSKADIRERIRREFDNPRVIVYGHTHEAYWGEERGVWFLNPGSPTDTTVAPFRSWGILTLENGKIRGEIIRL